MRNGTEREKKKKTKKNRMKDTAISNLSTVNRKQQQDFEKKKKRIRG